MTMRFYSHPVCAGIYGRYIDVKNPTLLECRREIRRIRAAFQVILLDSITRAGSEYVITVKIQETFNGAK